MRILGVDPGYERLGVAIIEKPTVGKEQLLFSDCLQTAKSLTFGERLFELGTSLEELIARFAPRSIALEKLFLTKNHKTAMSVAEIRGVITYVAAKNGLSIFEYTPGQVKAAVTGYGAATKPQVEMMVKQLIKLETTPKYDDEFDAIAVALTCAASERF